MIRQHRRKPSSIYWCPNCNLPLISPDCALCGTAGHGIEPGPPGDVRFCSAFERTLLHDLLMERYGVDPVGDRIILLNKIGGEDRTDQVIVDGLYFGILMFDLKVLDWQLDLQMDGAAVMAQHTGRRTIELSDAPGHLSGKTIRSDLVHRCSSEIRQGDEVIVRYGNLVGAGTALLEAKDMTALSNAPALRIRKIGRTQARLSDNVPAMADAIKANLPAIKRLGKDAINTVRGIINQKEFGGESVYVSFSGGKDSLVVLDITRSALKTKNPQAYFINTGLEFPETVEYTRRFCRENGIPLLELDAGDTFWQHLPHFGPPAKDYRWCCKVCKLSPAGRITAEGDFLTIDGKRRYESFSRARIAPKEENPFVPGQINVYPIRDWRAIEVWLYIHWRGLKYNPLYDQGFERIGCWLCPAALTGEYRQMEMLHPDLYIKWETYLKDWAADGGLAGEYIDRGFWRWREHPPKMRILAEQSGISLQREPVESMTFEIKVVSGISPCRTGGYSMEGTARGVPMKNAAETLKTMGIVHQSGELGVILGLTPEGSVKLFTDGTVQVNAADEALAQELFTAASRQMARAAGCTGCGICVKTCPHDAIHISGTTIKVTEQCDRCGQCTRVCVVSRYMAN